MRPPDFDPNQDTGQENHWQTLKLLSRHLWPKDRPELKIRVLLALACLAGAKLLNVYVPFLLKTSIDELSPRETALVLPFGFIVAYGIARLMVSAFGELRDWIFIRVSQHAKRTVALETFKHLHALPLAFHLSRQTGGLSRVIERGTRAISFVLSFMTFNIVPTFIEIALVTGILFYTFDWRYAVIVFVTIAAYIISTLVVTEWRIKFRRKMNQNESIANTKSIDSLLNFETVKYFSNEDWEYNRFDENLKEYESAAVTNQASLSFLNLSQAAIISFGLILILLIAGKGVVAKDLTIGDFVMINTFLIQLYLPLNFLGFVYREMKQSFVDMDKMFELTSVSASIRDKEGAPPLRINQAEIRFNHVNFSYQPERQILKDVNFEVKPGHTVAVVGPSGSGKSTLARLIFRFYDVNDGSIQIDGQDIRDVTQKSLRESIGVVPQDTVLFNESIEYNIQYGKPDASFEEIETAAQMAQIGPFINSLPKKYDTAVGERGLKLSGGEKQRVAIARTILKNPKILVFDEATSALDTETEKAIQKSLAEISKNRTTLMIAHRLSTIVHADQIIVLKDGAIVERGTHNELLAQKGEYEAMWNRQLEEEKN